MKTNPCVICEELEKKAFKAVIVWHNLKCVDPNMYRGNERVAIILLKEDVLFDMLTADHEYHHHACYRRSQWYE